ncbi:MAG: acyl-CoA dehydrogenase family protein [Ignavibacteriaceae bacterium]|jgi:alkylation response protein AidB-like acyl-CoA dehydrogenase|nr:acyl-CoA dehydrogenase family protein [Ignavibacteriaceae bacterium]
MSRRPIEQWIQLVHKIGKDFETRAQEYDRDDKFVAENYSVLKENDFFKAIIPEELGGSGLTHSEMCDILRILAQYCGSTALALSMHQHLLSANVWKYKQGQGMEEMLKKVAANQPVLISTGANDWLESSGEMEKTKDGFLVTAVKHFASQSAGGDILVTSAAYEDPENGKQVLHFAVPIKSQGITVLNNWQALGMRGTGSHSVKLDKVFIPETAITLRRPKGEFHPVWNVILTVAMPLIMSVYLGIAQKAARIAINHAANQKKDRPYIPELIGEMYNTLTTAELNVKDMIRIANDFNFKPIDQNGQDILTRKTNAANASIKVVEKAMEIVGGQGFYRSFGLERLFRDVQAAKYHPLQEKDQLRFTGEYILRNESKNSHVILAA